MGIRAALTHRTTYEYDRLITLGPQVVRLRPAPHTRTSILSYGFKVEPKAHFLNWQQDPFGNYLARLVFPERTRRFSVTVDLVADLAPINPFDFFLEDHATFTPFGYDADTRKDLAPYLEPVPGGPLFEALVAREEDEWRHGGERIVAANPDAEGLTTNDFLVGVNQRLQQAIAYTVRMEPGVQTPEETLEKALGSCRDSAWLMVALMRRLGIAARFVSGYLIQLKADELPIEGPSGPEADFTDLHAWTEVYLPGAGWIGLDPTSGLFAAEGHVPLAATPSPTTAAAISGGHEPCEVEFSFHMDVRRVEETARITYPFTDADWRKIIATGDHVDRLLDDGDVRLTMGGEPTFVASTDRDAPEWNIEAVGPTKRAYADKFIRKLRDRFAPNGLLHHGQGKWYPGEQLPRWAFALYWRGDGFPLWTNESRIAEENGPRTAGVADAERFMGALCDALEVDADCAAPAYEDAAAYVLREAELPANVDPIDNRLDDPEERARLVKVFERGLGAPAAFVLPLHAQYPQARALRRAYRWGSERWRTRRGKLFLKPGDSPSGFRLPLGSLAYLDPSRRPEIIPLDPFAARGALPARDPVFQSPPGPDAPMAPAEPPAPEYEDVPPGAGFYGGGPAVRTALTVEPRDGVICVFLPPVRSGDEFVDLVAAVEEAAAATDLPVHVEGYPPPPDSRINVIKVTPDPGVIEVNVHPAHSWREQVAITEAVYQTARECRMEASKFMIDGRPAGSGGGAHIVVGGATTADSPFLRRPDLLASIVRYWQNHPSLSYFFSGLFIGPTSQAPRIDEARQDVLYEMEIALKQTPDPLHATGADCPPWLVDRIFRHLLTDVTGNTHRSEICIDKLYSPDGPTGRLGLVEFRGFEMPPHPRMNIAQALILRALIAWFWREPCRAPLIRHGAALHDKFMLPHFLLQDFRRVLADLSTGLGTPFDIDWFRAQYDFRFPLLGRLEAPEARIELRSALEPWHVLGEEGIVGGVARFVDSSLDRIQVSVDGLDPTRYAIACNGWRLPLTPVEGGEGYSHLQGVRFRTWLPASCLHPTIPPHGPLVFDVYDLRNERSVAGCTYYTSHPGGRNYEVQPVNALEADSRMKSRFAAFGSAPGSFILREPPPSPELPTTFDMRRL
ncbi:MAG: IMP dehydrogenase [Alphaproteobacteria bacterium]|nr:IMP dehydrogenase [Alphaproteobacteria bacterium]